MNDEILILFCLFIIAAIVVAVRAAGSTRDELALGKARHSTSSNLNPVEPLAPAILLGTDSAEVEVVYTGEKHLLSFGATRSGKGTGAILPNAISYNGPIIIFDPKDEVLAAVGHYAPNKVMHRCAPLSKDNGALTIDMVAMVRASSDINAAISALCELIVIPSTDATQMFFENEARSLLKGILLFVSTMQNGTLRDVVELVAADQLDLEHKLRQVADDTISSWETKTHIVRYLNKAPNEKSGVLSMLRQNLAFLDNPSILNSLSTGACGIQSFLNANSVIVYVLPPQDFLYYYRWARVIIGMNLFELLQERQKNVLYIIDEMTAVGELKIVAQAFSLMAGYGVRIWGVFQDLSQLRQRYSTEWESFIANSGVVQCFSANDVFTADYLSKRIGATTKYVKLNSKEGWSETVVSYPLMNPDELSRMDRSKGALLVENNNVLIFNKLRHYVYFDKDC
jgi:type IV secretion system protein VirD4